MKQNEGDWQDFELWIQTLREERAKSKSGLSPLLFRGHADSDWLLTTTLERNWPQSMSFDEYYRLVSSRVGPAVQMFTDIQVPAYSLETRNIFTNPDPIITPIPVDLYRYMAYLRHHGFPSPLLDWSQSPYVAAFFAFNDAHSNEHKKKRTVYAYCERPEGVKGGIVGKATIFPMGPYVPVDPRHYRQQSWYTVCASFRRGDQWRFDSHQRVFDRNDQRQDVLWRFDFPSEDRTKVLKILNDYNLNAFSLFDSEDALLQTMWLREQVLRNSSS